MAQKSGSQQVCGGGGLFQCAQKSFAPPCLITSFYIIAQVKRTNGQLTIYISHTFFLLRPPYYYRHIPSRFSSSYNAG